jgi:hypothetical protein
MKWTVLWKPSAENALANIWAAASDKAAITKAANHLDAWMHCCGVIRLIRENLASPTSLRV